MHVLLVEDEEIIARPLASLLRAEGWTVETAPTAAQAQELIAQRAAAKKEKNFAEADRIRGVLADMGVTIKDTRQGTQWSRN